MLCLRFVVEIQDMQKHLKSNLIQQKISYNTLVEFFYKTHDPTAANRQGPNVGTQYRCTIFYHSSEQKEIAEKVTKQVLTL